MISDTLFEQINNELQSGASVKDAILKYCDLIAKNTSYLSRDVLIKQSIDEFFSQKDISRPYDFDSLSSQIQMFINANIELSNSLKIHEKYKLVTGLGIGELGQIIYYLYSFKNVKRDKQADVDTTELMYYSSDGWYKPASDFIEHLCRSLSTKIISKDIREVELYLKYRAGDPVDEERNPNWVFCKNGIFDKEYWKQNHELIPYSEDIIAVNPLPIDFNPDAINSRFDFDGDIFDVEQWLLDLANGSETIKKQLWDVFSALVYHNRGFKKAVILYAPRGNNGKGTFLEGCRSLVGRNNVANLSIDQFTDKSLVLKLLSSRLVAGDENPVDAYVDNSTNFKNAVTGDPVSIDRKYKNAITFSFSGLVIQCMNGLPTTKDKTDSFYRRLHLIPFNNWFGDNANDLIKVKYLRDECVLEYILNKALMLDVKELTDSDESNELMEEYKEDNDTLIQWWNDEGSQVDYAWDRVPFKLFYGSYKWWMKNNSVKGDVNMSLSKFTREFKLKILPVTDDWELDGDSKFSVGNCWEKPEPLIAKYNIDELKNPMYKGSDWIKIGSNGGQYPKTARGLIRK